MYPLDHQLCHIQVYDDGEYLDTIMREGDGPGPGEIRNSGVVFLGADGRLAVQHGYPTRLDFVDLDGTPRGRWQLQANAGANRIQETPRAGFAVCQDSRQGDDPGAFISVFHAALHDDEGRRTEEFHRETRTATSRAW